MQVHPLESATQGHSPGVRTRANYPGASRADPGYHGPRVGSVCRPLLGPGRIVSGTLLSHHRRVGACMEDREVPTQVHSQDPDGAGGGPESARGHRMGGEPQTAARYTQGPCPPRSLAELRRQGCTSCRQSPEPSGPPQADLVVEMPGRASPTPPSCPGPSLLSPASPLSALPHPITSHLSVLASIGPPPSCHFPGTDPAVPSHLPVLSLGLV